jgi:uncharacterized membrane protein
LAKIEKSIEIAVPPTHVWAYIVNPQNFLKWSGTLENLELIHETIDGIGTQVRGTFGLMTFIIEVVELVENQKIVTQSIDGDFKSFSQAFQLESCNEHTCFTYLIDYRVPQILGGRVIDRLLVQRTIEEEMTIGLTRLKQQLEYTWHLLSHTQRD